MDQFGMARLLLLLSGLIHGSLSQVDQMAVIIGDPNHAENDILGPPLSEKELQESLKIKIDMNHVPDTSDPITESGYFQGDIMVGSGDELEQILLGDPNKQLSAINNPQMLWPKGVIPYTISSSYSYEERQIIGRAMMEFVQRTCISFVGRTNEVNYIHILKGQGCSSSIGEVHRGRQTVSLADRCVHIGIAIHELMHAAGFWHEQSRADRDYYVTIRWSNIIPSRQYNFNKTSNQVTTLLGQDYDYASLMHYGPMAFAIDRSLPTIIPKRKGVKIGQRNGFSQGDVDGLNLLYKCTDVGPTSSCSDEETSCPYWASHGQCEAYPDYMKKNCKKSCKFCGGQGRNCKDQTPKCQSWSTTGGCSKFPSEAANYCPKSCGLC